jgi:hypothetical protein
MLSEVCFQSRRSKQTPVVLGRVIEEGLHVLLKEMSMTELTEEQCEILITFVIQETGYGLTRVQFGEQLLDLFEDISGFETITPTEAESIINHLWEVYVQNSIH